MDSQTDRWTEGKTTWNYSEGNTVKYSYLPKIHETVTVYLTLYLREVTHIQHKQEQHGQDLPIFELLSSTNSPSSYLPKIVKAYLILYLREVTHIQHKPEQHSGDLPIPRATQFNKQSIQFILVQLAHIFPLLQHHQAMVYDVTDNVWVEAVFMPGNTPDYFLPNTRVHY